MVPLKMPMSFQGCSQLLVVQRFPVAIWDHFPSQTKMLPIGSHERKKSVSLLRWKFHALCYKIHTYCTMDTSDWLQLRRKTWHASHWAAGNVLTFQHTKLGSVFIEKLHSLKCLIMQNADWIKNNSSLSESRGRGPPPWHSFLFLLIGFCLHSEQCVCPRAELALQHFPHQLCPAGTDQGDPVWTGLLGSRELLSSHKTWSSSLTRHLIREGESRWQEFFFLLLAFLGLGQPLNLQGHQLLERLKERQSWRKKLPRRWTQPWAQLRNRQTSCWAYI